MAPGCDPHSLAILRLKDHNHDSALRAIRDCMDIGRYYPSEYTPSGVIDHLLDYQDHSIQPSSHEATRATFRALISARPLIG